MHNRNFNASSITTRRMEKAIAGSMLSSNLRAKQSSYRDSSLLYQVQLGHQTQYTKFIGGCVGISPGCPCPELNASLVSTPYVPALPGAVSGIIYTVGSIIVSWLSPSSGSGPFTYVVTPYWNGSAQPSVETAETSYRFTNLQEGETYHFTVCAKNALGQGPVVPATETIVAPPQELSDVIHGQGAPIVDPAVSVKYMMDIGLEHVMRHAVLVKWGPTRGARMMYLWTASIVQAWNWVSSELFLTGLVDQWDWSQRASLPLSPRDLILWMCAVMDTVTQTLLPTSGYRSLFPFSESEIQRVKGMGEWSAWYAKWMLWQQSRQQDGSSAASTDQPVGSANWNQTIVVDGVTVNPIGSFPAPREWTALTVGGKRQSYLTYRWGDVRSTCLTAEAEAPFSQNYVPAIGGARDAEIDNVLLLSGQLTEAQKMAAEFWAGGPATVSPPLMMLWLWKEYVRTQSVSCSVLLYSLLDLSVHLFESSRMIWRLKGLFMESRPLQEIRRRYAGQMVSSWNGSVDGAQWTPYQTANFVTPPFADFPSGHSSFSKSFALVMRKWFGPDIQKVPVRYHRMNLMSPMFSSDQQGLFGDFVIPVGSSEVEPAAVPSAPLTLSFSTWNDMATSAGMSRLYGGIHCLTAHSGSQAVAIALHQLLEVGWNIPTFGMQYEPPVLPLPSAPLEPQPQPQPQPEEPVEPVPEPVEPQPEPEPEPEPVEPVPEPVEPQPEPQPEPVPQPEPEPVEPQPEPEPVPVPVVPYTIQIQYVSQVPSQEVQALLATSTQWIQQLMTQSHGYRLSSVSAEYDMIVDVDIQPLAAGILAGARPTVWNTATGQMPAMPLRQSVTLNSNALNSSSLLSMCLLNGQSVMKLIPVMIHEMIHGLGVASLPSTLDTVGWGTFLDGTRTWYVGHNGQQASQAIQAYREAIGSTAVHRIPVENSFGAGTAYSHWEEGLTDGFTAELRTYNYGSGPVVHPALPNEIMTGIAGSSFYLTKLTAGALADYGYSVNLSSSSIAPYPI